MASSVWLPVARSVERRPSRGRKGCRSRRKDAVNCPSNDRPDKQRLMASSWALFKGWIRPEAEAQDCRNRTQEMKEADA